LSGFSGALKDADLRPFRPRRVIRSRWITERITERTTRERGGADTEDLYLSDLFVAGKCGDFAGDLRPRGDAV
jgi:hypothetical protein